MTTKHFSKLTPQQIRELATKLRIMIQDVENLAAKMDLVGCKAISLAYMTNFDGAIAALSRWAGHMEERVKHQELWMALDQDTATDPDLTEMRKRRIESAIDPKKGRPRKGTTPKKSS